MQLDNSVAAMVAPPRWVVLGEEDVRHVAPRVRDKGNDGAGYRIGQAW
jgi:hypothetical protein